MINACTHPFVFLVLPLLLDQCATYVIVAEVFAIIAEAFLAKFAIKTLVIECDCQCSQLAIWILAFVWCATRCWQRV